MQINEHFLFVYCANKYIYLFCLDEKKSFLTVLTTLPITYQFVPLFLKDIIHSIYLSRIKVQIEIDK